MCVCGTLTDGWTAQQVVQCGYRMHLARLLLDETKNPKKKGKKGKGKGKKKK